MKDSKLEEEYINEKIFKLIDWIPVIGGINFYFNRRYRIPFQERESLFGEVYKIGNILYTAGTIYGLYKLIKNLTQ